MKRFTLVWAQANWVGVYKLPHISDKGWDGKSNPPDLQVHIWSLWRRSYKMPYLHWSCQSFGVLGGTAWVSISFLLCILRLCYQCFGILVNRAQKVLHWVLTLTDCTFCWWACCRWSATDTCANDNRCKHGAAVFKWGYRMCYCFSFPMDGLYTEKSDRKRRVHFYFFFTMELEVLVEDVNMPSVSTKK